MRSVHPTVSSPGTVIAQCNRAISDAVDAFAEAGVDELIFDPTVADPGQVDLLAEVVF